MNLQKIPYGNLDKEEFNAVIEIQGGAAPVKYEFDYDSGCMFVDRIVATPVFYPCNYGFIPNTKADDGDALDALVIAQEPLAIGSVIKVRPVGVLCMEDESGRDEKILFVPVSSVTSYYDNVAQYGDLPKLLLDRLTFFFERYKDLEKDKWVKVSGFEGKQRALEIIKSTI